MGVYIFTPVMCFLPENISAANQLADKLGYDGKPGDDRKILHFYKKIDIDIVVMARMERFFNKVTWNKISFILSELRTIHGILQFYLPNFQNTPQIYPVSRFLCTPESSENSPLPVSPRKLIPHTNRVPIMIGFCQREACMAVVERRKSIRRKPTY